MLSIANEINFPVTAFIKKKQGEIATYDIRYFTPITEIPACGHATLAASKSVSLQQGAGNAWEFHTVTNISIKTFVEANRILMTYPVYVMEEQVINAELLAALDLNDYKTAGYCEDLETLFIELESAESLRKIQPDYRRLVKSSKVIKEVVITSVSDNANFDYYLRSFCPWIGIDEDPVTGSVHSVLGNFWKKRLHKEFMNVYQASPRGGELVVRAFDDHVKIGGEAVVILAGEIML
jgi:PhzF family phenazine biosynthesis protein